MTPFRLALLSLLRRKVSSFIALTAIAVSVACSGALLRLYYLSGARFSTLGQGGDAVVGAKAGGIEILLGSLNGEGDYPDFLPYRLYESLKSEQALYFEDGYQSRRSYLESVIPVLFFGKYRDYRVMGTESSFFYRPRPNDNVRLAQGAIASAPLQVTLGAAVAQKSGLKIGDLVPITPWTGQSVESSPILFRVVGILEATGSVWDRMLYTTVEQAQEVLGETNLQERSIWGNHVLHYFLIYLDPAGYPMLESLINRRTVGQVIWVAEAKARLHELTGTGRRLGFFMTFFIIFLGGLSVAAMLVTRFEAMSIQFAVLRAMGYAKQEVGRWLMWEGLLLGAVACAVGALIEMSAFPVLRTMLGSALPTADIVASPIHLSAPVWLAAIAATMLSVFIPLIRLYHQDVHFSLKGV